MKQYLKLLSDIKEKGTLKSPAREGMPTTISLFGYQFRHNMQDGFPLLTTKKMFWKGIVIELLWFLKGDTNIKYLVDNGVNIWNEDAYNYYKKICQINGLKSEERLNFNNFIELIKKGFYDEKLNYNLGDCGFQYGKVWRAWEKNGIECEPYDLVNISEEIDQIKNLIDGLKNNPEGRRHIVTSIDPAHDQDLALYWCHCLMQFNCRLMTIQERENYAINVMKLNTLGNNGKFHGEYLDDLNVPRYYLDLQWYQRSADVFLGVPFNIASYGLLLEIISKMCNMVTGELISTYGDVHIYENHIEQVEEQLSREPLQLPILKIKLENLNSIDGSIGYFDNIIYNDFEIENYNSHPAIKAELKTGLK